MIHYTINTGHSRETPRSEVADDVLPIVEPWLSPGEHPLPMLGAAVRLSVAEPGDQSWLGTIYNGPAPIVTIAIALTPWGAAQVWPQIERLYLDLTDRALAGADWQSPRQPQSTPWVAAVIVGSAPQQVMSAIGDLERCLAWAFAVITGEEYRECAQ